MTSIDVGYGCSFFSGHMWEKHVPMTAFFPGPFAIIETSHRERPDFQEEKCFRCLYRSTTAFPTQIQYIRSSLFWVYIHMITYVYVLYICTYIYVYGSEYIYITYRFSQTNTHARTHTHDYIWLCIYIHTYAHVFVFTKACWWCLPYLPPNESVEGARSICGFTTVFWSTDFGVTKGQHRCLQTPARGNPVWGRIQ